MVPAPRSLPVVLVLAALALAPLPAYGQAPAPAGVPQQGPDMPAAGLATTTVTVFEADLWSWTEGVRTATVPVPAGYDRVLVELRIWPEGDPWDRLFAVHVSGVEVLHGTTPRTDMTVRRDITEYSALLPEGGTADVGLYLGTWVGALRATLRLHFHADEPTSLLVGRPADDVVPGMLFVWRGGGTVSRPVAFPGTIPTMATVEFFASGHGSEEFWYTDSVLPRVFEIHVDGTMVMRAVAMPYVYALLGFSGSFGNTVHGPMWWTAQQGLDIAGVHTGVGEIPPYRATITDPDVLGLLSGDRTLEVKMGIQECCWITSVGFLLYDGLA